MERNLGITRKHGFVVLFKHGGQYGVGPREKRIILTILPELKRHELKFSMKIAFSFLAIMLN